MIAVGKNWFHSEMPTSTTLPISDWNPGKVHAFRWS